MVLVRADLQELLTVKQLALATVNLSSSEQDVLVVCLYVLLITPLKINMEAKDHLFEKETHLPNLHFWGSTLIFGSVFVSVLFFVHKYRCSSRKPTDYLICSNISQMHKCSAKKQRVMFGKL